MSDTIKFEKEEYVIVGIRGDDLFNPEFTGINLYSRCTACWRGFTLYYEVYNHCLILQGILLNTKDTAPPINDKFPVNAEEFFFDYLYENLDYRSDFTGTLLIAREFIQELYVHMGFQAPTSYKKVVEIVIENGKIISSKDLSERMEYLRNHEMIFT